MTADEVFQELGYEKREANHDVYYIKENADTIGFHYLLHECDSSRCSDKLVKQAITKKLEELRW